MKHGPELKKKKLHGCSLTKKEKWGRVGGGADCVLEGDKRL